MPQLVQCVKEKHTKTFADIQKIKCKGNVDWRCIIHAMRYRRAF